MLYKTPVSMITTRDAMLKPRLRAEVSEPVFLVSRIPYRVVGKHYYSVAELTLRYQAVVWTFLALSLIFLCVRCVIKIKTFKRVAADDIVAIAAWILFLVNVILWTIMAPRLYENYHMLQGKGPIDEAGMARNWERYGEFVHVIAPFKMMFYTSLWTVKISLLLFFRKLGHQIRSHEIWWWCVLVVTVSTWLVCIGDIDYTCTTKPWPYIFSKSSKRPV